jgi:iron complex transport system substrate-binding protein
MTSPLSRRTFGLLGAGGLLTACSDTGSSAEPVAAQPTSSQFPVTVEHRLGSTTIPAQPRRVVALGTGDVAAVLALGVTPVGVLAASMTDSGVWPWETDLVDPAATTLLSNAGAGFDLEQIAALAPDLVLAHGVTGIDDLYADLSALAPTIADEKGLLADSWQDVVTTAGTALGVDPAPVVAAVEDDVAATAADFPALQGRTYVVAWMRDAASVAVMSAPDDVTSEFFAGLGLSVAPGAAALGLNDRGAASVGLEDLSALEADVRLVAYSSPDLQTSLESNALFTALPGVYQPLDLVQISALRVPTATNVGWTLDHLTPLFGEIP